MTLEESRADGLIDRSVCAVCGRKTEAIMRTMRDGDVCMECNPFRRCECLGLFVSKPTPNDMSRCICDKCGKKTRI